MRPNLCCGRDRLDHRSLPCLHGAPILHRLNGSLLRAAIVGGDARAPGEALMELNDKAPYRHWHRLARFSRAKRFMLSKRILS
jgi:hypothetical protein